MFFTSITIKMRGHTTYTEEETNENNKITIFHFRAKKNKIFKIIFLRNKQNWKLISYSRFLLHFQSKWVVMQPIQKQNPSKHWKFTFFFHLGQKTNFKVSLLQKWINWKSISYSWSSLHYNQNEGYHTTYTEEKPAKTIKSHFFHFRAKKK